TGAGPDTVVTGPNANEILWDVANGLLTVKGGGQNTLRVAGSANSADVIRIAKQLVSPGVFRVVVTTASSAHQVVADSLQQIYYEGGPKGNQVTVDDLGGTSVQQVGINLSLVANPSHLKNTIQVNAPPADTLTIQKQSVYAHEGAQTTVDDLVTRI